MAPGTARVVAFVMPQPGVESWNYGLRYSYKHITMKPEVIAAFAQEQQQRDDSARANVLTRVFTGATIRCDWQEELVANGLESLLAVFEHSYHIHAPGDFHSLTESQWAAVSAGLPDKEDQWKLREFRDLMQAEGGSGSTSLPPPPPTLAQGTRTEKHS